VSAETANDQREVKGVHVIIATSTFHIGATCFGVVIGWIVYRTLRRTDAIAISDIATVIGAVGGGAVLGIFKSETSFGWYAIGLAGGFFAYLLLSLALGGAKATGKWMGGADVTERITVTRNVDNVDQI
jgi:hypothetical protein